MIPPRLRKQLNKYDDAELAAAKLLNQGYSPRDTYFLIARNYSFALPTKESLEALLALSPLVDIGAGNGHWAYRLKKLGADIVAVAHFPDSAG